MEAAYWAFKVLQAAFYIAVIIWLLGPRTNPAKRIVRGEEEQRGCSGPAACGKHRPSQASDDERRWNQ